MFALSFEEMSDFFEDSDAEENGKSKESLSSTEKSILPSGLEIPSESIQDFESLKNALISQCNLEYYYESPKNHLVAFMDSEILLNSSRSNDRPYERTNNSSESVLRPVSVKNCGELQKEMIKKIEKNKILLLQTNQIFDNIIEFVKYGMQKWSIESILKVFDWKDFEILISDILGEFGYRSIRTFRFSSKKQRHEIDIIARNRDTIFFIDGKHWQSNKPGLLTFRKIADQQKKRAEMLTKDPDASGLLLQKLHTTLDENQHKSFKIYPIIVISFNEPEIRWVDSIPIVPIHTFNQFIIDFHSYNDKFYYSELNRATIQHTLNHPLKFKQKSNKK